MKKWTGARCERNTETKDNAKNAMKQSRRLHSRLVDGNAQMRREYAKNAFKENSYKVGVCFFQVGVQIRRQVS